MSSMLEQAIIDAAALREAALKNAEQSLIEKYAPQIKKAVETMLEETTVPQRMKYEGTMVNIVHEADASGMVTVAERGGKPFVVRENELSGASDDELLQEEEMDMGMGGGESSASPNASIEAPFAGNPNAQNDKMVDLRLDIATMEGDIDINLSDLEKEITEMDMDGEETSIGDLAGDMEAEESGMDDLMGGDELVTDEGGEEMGAEEELQLQELLNLLSEHDVEPLEEEFAPGGPEGAVKPGWITTAAFQNEEQQDLQNVADNLYPTDEEDEDSDDETDEEGDPVTEKLYEMIKIIKSQNKDLETVVYKLNDKLEETLLSNAKLIYQNRTLCDASLNERQKVKIVEAIAKAESPKEAKRLHETLRTTVGSKQKKGPQSLSESINRRSNLTGIINRGQNLNERQTSDPFFAKMKKLAGIK
tara:strand:- start:2522 stop:3781 length:1260 start_codon:yes stop_codon:yes gene_type:complete